MTSISEDQALLLALCKIKTANWYVLAREAQRHDGLQRLARGEVTETSAEALATAEAIRGSLDRLDELKAEAHTEVDRARTVDARLFTVIDDGYPATLRLIFNLPPFLFVRGGFREGGPAQRRRCRYPAGDPTWCAPCRFNGPPAGGKRCHGRVRPGPWHRHRGPTRLPSTAEQDELSLPFLFDPPAIVKTRATPKMRLTANAAERRAAAQELHKALVVPDVKLVRGRSFLVYDDVFTGGNTLNAVAGRLKDSGASGVCGLALARARWRY